MLALSPSNSARETDSPVTVFSDSNRHLGLDDGVNTSDLVGYFPSGLKEERTVNGTRHGGYRLLNGVELWKDI